MNRKRRSFLGLERLEDRKLLSVLVAERENNNRVGRANEFAFDGDGIVQLQGVSQNRGDKDFFRFTAPATGVMNIAVRARNGAFAQLEVESQGGVRLFETQPADGANSGSLSLTAGQAYFVRLRSPVNARASYAVDLFLGGSPTSGGTGTPSPVAVVSDSRRDDSLAQANAVTLSPGNVVELRGTVTRRDRDFYSFIAPQSGPLSIDSMTTNGVMAKVELDDATGNLLFETEPKDGVNTGTVPLTAGQTYFLQVRPVINTATASYRVDLLFGAVVAGGGSTASGGTGGTAGAGTVIETEPNDTKGAADPFNLGITGSARLQGTSANKDDRDYFVFTPTQSGTLNAVVSTTNGVFAQLEIEDLQSRTLLETEPNDGINSGRAAVVAGQTYFVRLRAKGDAPAAYLVDLLFDGSAAGGTTGGSTGGTGGTVGGVFTETEPNEEKSSADAFSLDASHPAQLTGSLTSKDDRDFFALTAARSGTVSVTLASTSGPLAKLEIEDSASDNLLDLEDGRTNGSFAVTAGTTYFLRLRASGNAASSYRIDLSLT
ncbi:MAG: hypothetical protein JWN86_1585 [Planctomycetota bacterium]|nr:hypothetical protein [Planctomycetota bacterium]